MFGLGLTELLLLLALPAVLIVGGAMVYLIIRLAVRDDNQNDHRSG